MRLYSPRDFGAFHDTIVHRDDLLRGTPPRRSPMARAAVSRHLMSSMAVSGSFDAPLITSMMAFPALFQVFSVGSDGRQDEEPELGEIRGIQHLFEQVPEAGFDRSAVGLATG